MPCEVIVLNDGKLVLERWTGLVTFEDVAAHNQYLLQDPSIAQGAAALIDCRTALIALPVERVGELAIPHGDPAGQFKISRFAFVMAADSDAHAQAFTREVQKHGITAIVFTSLSVACQWLGVDPADVPQA
jgi:hypothetical protein